jgi:hypothetical protein
LDTTNVSPMNKFATLVRATGYVTVAECTPKRRTFRCGPGESGAGLSRLHAARSSRPFEQSLAMVALCVRSELTSSEHQEPAKPSGCANRLR